MKLKKYENKELRKSKIAFFVLSSLCIILLILFVYQSYARYQDKVTFKIINGKLKMSGGSGDIEFAFYNGDKTLTTMPTKNNEEGLVFIKATCTNDAILTWNAKNWDVTISNLTKTKTSCSLYFGSKTEKICTSAGEESGACYLAKKSDNDKTNFAYDDTNDANLRYIGSTPNNYVYFNCEDNSAPSKETCETWRIIGVMNNITEVSEDELQTETNGTHLKIIRDKFEKNYSWDSSLGGSSGANNGQGVNEWSEADIEKVLNDEYLYRRAGSNRCYKDDSNTTETCPDWANIGIRNEARSMIANVKWNTGTLAENYSSFYNDVEKFNAKGMYESERSSHTGKELCQASGTSYCNDKVNRTTIWTGKVGLMYPSDYGYAVGTEVRVTCLGDTMTSYKNNNCMTNDWLYDANNDQWTMIPEPNLSYASSVFSVISNGLVNSGTTCNAKAIRPTLYLSSSVKIIDGSGEASDPFVLSL